ncbi:MAG: DNA-directed RNA polymerase subunit alpha [Candidatus Schekmanbacteria bacterium]|nr:DNA-directed RNA polymerase subunit alpha [Candidatus Schekmanbacteria bacterium]
MELQLTTPRKIEFDPETLTPGYGKLLAEPFERGYGVTMGNAFRRVLLSSLPGAAVTALKIAGARHEFSTIPGVVEDVTDIILNIKSLLVRLKVPGPKTIYLRAEKGPEVTAADITPDPDVEIMNPALHIATLEGDALLDVELTVKQGRGYATAEQNTERDMPIGVIAIDSVFTPVQKVNFSVENARLGQWTEYDKLILEVWTNKTVGPEAAVAQAAGILRDHFDMLERAFMGAVSSAAGARESASSVAAAESASSTPDRRVEVSSGASVEG